MSFPGSDSIEHYLSASWPAPASIQTLISQNNSAFTALGEAPAAREKFGFNLATHVGDDKNTVLARRQALAQSLAADIFWLEQVHGTRILNLDTLLETQSKTINVAACDASFTFSRNKVCAILTADCLPVLWCHQQGLFVAALHAGWKGLYQDILEKSLQAISSYAQSLGIKIQSRDIQAYIAPAISQKNYQVDVAFYQRFIEKNTDFGTAFVADGEQHYRADLNAIARIQMQTLGIEHITDSRICTYQDPRFYSYRKNSDCGRFASMIWMR